MIKQLLLYVISFGIVFFALHLTQAYVLEINDISIRFNPQEVQIFFGIASFFICFHFFVLSYIKAVKPYLGYLYLATFFIKLALFYLKFNTSILSLSELSMPERLVLLVPLFIFLILEVFFITKILNK